MDAQEIKNKVVNEEPLIETVNKIYPAWAIINELASSVFIALYSVSCNLIQYFPVDSQTAMASSYNIL
jgi:hypothetical protein